MNSDIMHGKWLQIRGEVKKQWGKLTDDDLDRVNGDMDKLAGILQERYGYSRQQAEEHVRHFMQDFDTDRGMTDRDMDV